MSRQGGERGEEGGETASSGLLGTGTRRSVVVVVVVVVEDGTADGKEREREKTAEEREAEKLLKEATRNPRRRLTGRPVFSYGRHMVCTRWPKGLAAAAGTRC